MLSARLFVAGWLAVSVATGVALPGFAREAGHRAGLLGIEIAAGPPELQIRPGTRAVVVQRNSPDDWSLPAFVFAFAFDTPVHFKGEAGFEPGLAKGVHGCETSVTHDTL